ncbi:pancreatic secretory granule membrane major glycoprotein GP2-like [Silurus meridionalis]|nr:pancreatic secretory granule membrane major glycoprotein GP2-like [Silurus meridionalis]
MIPYPDPSFYIPYSGNVTLEVNQQLYIAVEVEQVDSNQTALVLGNCWATPVNQIDHSVRWDLIVNECPHPTDGMVTMLQNGVSSSSRFSIKMFTFTSFPTNIYLHCQVHLCQLDSGNCSVMRMGSPFESGSSQGFFLITSKGVFPCHSRHGLLIRDHTIPFTITVDLCKAALRQCLL